MRKVTTDFVRLNFICEDCDIKQSSIPIAEAVYNGPPLCPECEEEMSLEEQVDLLE